MKIGIAGAGAIGSYHAGLLSRAGQDVTLIARGEHLAAIHANGLEVKTPTETFVAKLNATDDADRLVGCEYVIVAVKGYSLPEVGPALAKAAASGATIVPLLNGIDAAERLEALGVPRAQIIGGLAAISVVRTAPGVVERFSPFDRITIGELDRVDRPRTAKLAEILAQGGVAANVSKDVVLDLWRKFAFIVPMTVVCGLTRQAVGRVVATERGRMLMRATLHEIVELSQVAGAPISSSDEQRIASDLFGVPASMRPSFLLDLERGGPTELDLLAATVTRLGEEYDISTPIHDVATTAFEIATR
ncbi:MAG TPA: 2-dehydropantoate 2-reductase [Gemmatimonadaceae bacterium]